MRWTFFNICAVDISPLLPMLDSLTDKDWEAGKVRQEAYENHKPAPCIPLKWGLRVQPEFASIEEGQKYFSEYVDTYDRNEYSEIWDRHKEVLKPVIDQVLDCIGMSKVKVARILLVNLPAGAEINMHTDGGKTLMKCDRIHIPIITNEKAVMQVQSDVRHYAAGEVFEINNSDLHAARNEGDEDRIHIILDIYDGDNKWL